MKIIENKYITKLGYIKCANCNSILLLDKDDIMTSSESIEHGLRINWIGKINNFDKYFICISCNHRNDFIEDYLIKDYKENEVK